MLIEKITNNAKSALNGMRGVHLVAAELALHGFAPVVTMRNTAFADILAQPLTFDGAPLSISVKYNAGGNGTFFLLGKKALPRNAKAFFVLVLEPKNKERRFWVVPAHVLADSQITKIKAGVRRLKQASKGYLGLHMGSWGHEVYFNHLQSFEDAWNLLSEAAKD